MAAESQLLIRAMPMLPAIHLPRLRLLAVLAEGLQPSKRLTILTGSPGSGKTTLLASYVRQAGTKSAWLSLSEGTPDPETCLCRLVEDLRSEIPDVSAQSAEVIATLGRSGLAQAIGLLCDDLASFVPSFILVLDDAHVWAQDALGIVALEAFIRFFPANFQLIFSARAPLPLKLATYRLRGQVVEVGETDLAFTRDEIERYLAVSFNGALEEELLDSVSERTRGWSTGVVYVAQGGPEDIERRLSRPALLYDFLAEELLGRLSVDYQQQLLLCAFLPRVDLKTCRNLFASGAEAFLATLESQPLFATRAGDAFTFQPIFREFLQREVRTKRPKEARDDLFHRLAYSGASGPEGQVEFLQLAGDWDTAEERLIAASSSLFKAGKVGALGRMIAAFPETRREQSSWLQYLDGEINRREGRLSRAIEILNTAERLESESQPNERPCDGRIMASLAAAYGARGDTSRQRESAELALQRLPTWERGPVAATHNALGMYHIYRREFGSADSCFKQALVLFREEEDPVGESLVLHNMGKALSDQGEFERAIACYEEAIRCARATGRLPLPLSYNNAALCYTYLGRLSEAWRTVEEGFAVAARSVALRDRVFLLRTLGRLHLRSGDLGQARGFIQNSLDEAVQIGDRLSQAYSHLGMAELALLEGDSKTASFAVERALDVSGRAIDDPDMLEAAMLRAEVAIRLSDTDDAERLLGDATTQTGSEASPYDAMHLERLLACLKSSQGNPAQAAAHERRMVEFALKHGYPLPTATLDVPTQKAIVEPVIPATSTRPGSHVDSPKKIPPRETWAVEVLSLGPFEVRLEGTPILAKQWRSSKAKAVLAYLLCHEAGATMESLLELLYPHEDAARSVLHVVIARLRQTLDLISGKGEPSRYVLFQDGRYLLNRGVPLRFDAAEFRQLLSDARRRSPGDPARLSALRRATTLYRGHFMDEFQELLWFQLERENLRRLFGECYEELFSAAAAEDDWPTLEALADTYLLLDRTGEVAYRAKIVALSMMDRPEDARRVAKITEAAIREALGTDPDEATSELVELVRQGKMTVRLARRFVPDLPDLIAKGS